MVEGRTAQINRNLEFLMNLLGQKSIIKERMKGYEKLESQQHINMLERAKKNWLLQISQDPSINRIMSQMFIDRKEGKPTKELETELKNAVDSTVGLIASVSSGREPTEEMWQKGLSNISDMTLRELLQQSGMTARQAKELPFEEAGAILRAGELQLGREQLEQRKRELDLEIKKTKQKPKEEQLNDWQKIVNDAVNFLETEGVKKDSSLRSDMRALFSSGKVTDPLSREHRGQAFAYLTMIQMKLANGELPSPGEEWFLINVRNSPEVEKYGLISPPEIDAIANYMMQTHGLDQATAYEKARQYILTKRGKINK